MDAERGFADIAVKIIIGALLVATFLVPFVCDLWEEWQNKSKRAGK